jgi:hypothetical protein
MKDAKKREKIARLNEMEKLCKLSISYYTDIINNPKRIGEPIEKAFLIAQKRWFDFNHDRKVAKDMIKKQKQQLVDIDKERATLKNTLSSIGRYLKLKARLAELEEKLGKEI